MSITTHAKSRPVLATPAGTRTNTRTLTNGVDMNHSIARPSDDNAASEDFESWMCEERPHVRPGTAAYAFEQRCYEQKVVVEQGELMNALYEGLSGPRWAVGELFKESNLPTRSHWRGEVAKVLLRRVPGKRNEGGSTTIAHLCAQLRQTVGMTEPCIHVSQNSLDRDTGDQIVTYEQFETTLDEAVELAHVLLLLVDVARESAAPEVA